VLSGACHPEADRVTCAEDDFEAAVHLASPESFEILAENIYTVPSQYSSASGIAVNAAEGVAYIGVRDGADSHILQVNLCSGRTSEMLTIGDITGLPQGVNHIADLSLHGNLLFFTTLSDAGTIGLGRHNVRKDTTFFTVPLPSVTSTAAGIAAREHDKNLLLTTDSALFKLDFATGAVLPVPRVPYTYTLDSPLAYNSFGKLHGVFREYFEIAAQRGYFDSEPPTDLALYEHFRTATTVFEVSRTSGVLSPKAGLGMADVAGFDFFNCESTSDHSQSASHHHGVDSSSSSSSSSSASSLDASTWWTSSSSYKK
jgi:hypothetical protein